MNQIIITILNAILASIGAGTTSAEILKGALSTIISDILAVAGNIGGGLDLNRIEALGQLTINAAKGYANSWQQLYNWANFVGQEYPHGNEPSETLGLAKTLYKILSTLFPAWAATITGPGGKNGDSPVDPNGPTLH